MDKEKYIYDIESIELDMIEKTSEEDAGRLMWGIYTSQSEGQPDSVLVDGNSNFLALVGEGEGGINPRNRVQVLVSLLSHRTQPVS